MTKSTWIIMLATGLLASSADAAKAANQPETMQIGIAKTFVPDQPKIFIDIAATEFSEVFAKMTGIACDIDVTHNPMHIAKKLQTKQLDFGILYAHEFAWARQKYPEMQPLLIAATKMKDKRAHVVVHKKNPAKSLSDLHGKKFDVPARTKEYCRLYLEMLCANHAKSKPTAFFGAITKSDSQMEALDQVASGRAHATVIDTPWLDTYKDLKGPVFEKNLRILQQSEIIPPAVVIYRKGGIEPATLERVRDGLRNMHTNARGQALMKLWHIDAFEPVPDDFLPSLDRQRKEFPSPQAAKS